MILITDDDRTIRVTLKLLLERNGYAVTTADGAAATMQVVRNEPALELVLMDMNYSPATDGEEGLTLLKQVKVFRPDVPVILMTAWGSIDLAVQGMRNGAFDFITKPWNNAVLMERIETATALAPRALKDAPTDTSGKNDNRFILSDGSMIVGQSPSLKSVIDTVRRVAPTQASVLITGESGTGKELIAQAIHEHSRRAGKPFVKVNLGGISTTLFESELFGHKKGAFTDAKSNRTGRFEMAEGGTIFLDEIGELELASQVKLLRVLQDQTYEVLGDSQPRRADVRVVCATNRDLRQMVTEKTFREDLFYRINLIHIHLPPLRERQEDIPLLVEHFVRQTAAANGLQNITATKEAVRYLQSLSFYGNIRELKNLVERTLLMSPDREIVTADDFKANLQPDTRLHPGTPSSGIQGNTLEEIERSTIEASVKRHGGNLTMVAKELGISRGALYRKMEKHRL